MLALSEHSSYRTIQICALFKPIFSLRLSISGYGISKTFTHDMSCAELCDHIWVNGTIVQDHYCGEANPMLLTVCTLNFVLGNTSMLFWKIYLDESLWCIVSVAPCSFLFLFQDMLLLSLFLCSNVGGTGAEWKWYIAVNCWLFNHQVLCRVCWFRHFAPRTMLLHSLPVKYPYTLWGSINLHNIQCIVFPTVNSGTLTQESQFSWYLQVAETY